MVAHFKHVIRWSKSILSEIQWTVSIASWELIREKFFLHDPTVEIPSDSWSNDCGYSRLWIGEIEHHPTIEIKSDMRSDGCYHFWLREGLKRYVLGWSGWSKYNPTVRKLRYGFNKISKDFRLFLLPEKGEKNLSINRGSENKRKKKKNQWKKKIR